MTTNKIFCPECNVLLISIEEVIKHSSLYSCDMTLKRFIDIGIVNEKDLVKPEGWIPPVHEGNHGLLSQLNKTTN